MWGADRPASTDDDTHLGRFSEFRSRSLKMMSGKSRKTRDVLGCGRMERRSGVGSECIYCFFLEKVDEGSLETVYIPAAHLLTRTTYRSCPSGGYLRHRLEHDHVHDKVACDKEAMLSLSSSSH